MHISELEDTYGDAVMHQVCVGGRCIVIDDIPHAGPLLAAHWERFIDERLRYLPPEYRLVEPVFVNLHLKKMGGVLLGGSRVACFGVQAAIDAIKEDPKRPVYIYGPMEGLLQLTRMRKELSSVTMGSKRPTDVLLSLLETHPIVRYMCIINTERGIMDELSSPFDRVRIFPGYTPGQIYIHAGKVLCDTDITIASVGTFLHDMKPGKREELIAQREREARILFPSAPEGRDALIDYLEWWKQAQKERMRPLPRSIQDKIVSGVFIDASGTLFDEDYLGVNKDIFEYIVATSLTRWVYVWTSGDIGPVYDAMQKYRELRNIPLLSKSMFSGLTVEECIDDMSSDALWEECEVKGLLHAQV